MTELDLIDLNMGRPFPTFGTDESCAARADVAFHGAIKWHNYNGHSMVRLVEVLPDGELVFAYLKPDWKPSYAIIDNKGQILQECYAADAAEMVNSYIRCSFWKISPNIDKRAAYYAAVTESLSTLTETI